MNKCYLLLRDNKETGPYSLSELLQLSLTGNDLIWVEGKSAGWRYPVEMEEFNEVLIKTNLVQPAAIAVEKVADIKENVDSPVTAKKIFVSLPSGVKKQPVTSTPSLEEKAEALRQKALSYSPSKTESTIVDNSRSIHEIKEEYSEWKQDQKRDKRSMRAGTQLAFAGLCLAIAGAAFFLLYRGPNKDEPLVSGVVVAKKDTPIITQKAAEPVAYKPVPDKPVQDKPVLEKPVVAVRQPSPAPAPSEVVIAKKLTKFPTVLQASVPAQKAEVKTPISAAKQTVATKKEEEIAIKDLMETSSHYVQNSDGIGLSVELHNKSNKKIRVAAVDVLYFDKSGQRMRKETIYFSDVQPGNTLTKISSYQKAASASYQVGLVSAESVGLYVMQ